MLKKLDAFLHSPTFVVIVVFLAFGTGYITGQDKSLEDVRVVSK